MDTLGSDWDDIELTPLKQTPDVKDSPDLMPAGSKWDIEDPQLKNIKDLICSGLKELDDSFMYLGVLKKQPLPDAMVFFETKIQHVYALLEGVWENRAFPGKKQLFSEIGEDYIKLTRLIHSGDAINPIYENLKNVYENVEALRDSGIGRWNAISLVKHIFTHRKS